MKQIYMLFLALSAFALQGIAQVSNYTFSQTTGTYSPVTGTTIHASSWDDAVVSATIPFTFTMNGVGYTTCSVNSNGYITFGGTVSLTNGFTPVSSTTGYAAAIAAFGRDIISNSSTVVSATVGTAPNRSFVVQWNNARRYSGGAITGDVLNFQIILNETTNIIDVVYGTCTATSTTSYTAQVGLRGASNSDYNNRTTTTNWTATTAGASNSATCTSSNTIMPTSGLTFTWTPLPCSGTPAAGTPTTPLFNTCPGSTQVLNVTGLTTDNGIAFQWESSPDGTTGWANVTGGTGATTPSYTTAAYGGTPIYYRLVSTCAPSGQSNVSPVITVTNPLAPSTQASAPVLTAVGATTATLSWTNGNGNNRTVYINSVNSFTDPVTPASPGTASTAWANAGQQLVLDGTGSSVSITGLTAGTTYYIRIYESQKCTAPAEWYYNTTTATGNPGSFATVTVPANDECANAATLTPQPFVAAGTCPNGVAGTTLGASASSVTAPPSSAFSTSQDDDVWYQFTATTASHIVRLCNVTFPIGSSTQMGITLNPGCTSASLEVTGNPSTSLITLSSGSGEIVFSGLTVGQLYKIRVLTSGTSARANFTISVLEPSPMSYVSATTTQSSTANVTVGAVNQQIIRLEVTVTGSAAPLSLSQIDFTTNGSTLPADIAAAKVFYTGTSTTFGTTTPFGTAVATPSGSFSVSGSQVLAGSAVGNTVNYFWLVYDLPCTATPTNVLDAECTGFVLGSAQVPTVTAPTGTRTIAATAAPTRTDGNGSTSIGIGATNAQMVYVNVTANNVGVCPSTVTTVNFTVAGTAPNTDIVNAKCYYTTTTTFSTANPFGTAIANPAAGAISFTGSQALANGANYFWLVYDIACSAVATNTVNGDAVSVVVNGNTTAVTGTATTANALAAATTFTTVANGEWSNPSTWACGAIPSSNTTPVTIANNITVSDAGNTAGNITIATGGSLTINAGGNLTTGTPGGGNRVFTNNGTLSVTGGTLTVNGNVLLASGSTFNQSGGNFVIDGNNGTAGGSVASGTTLLLINSNQGTVTGGTLTITDPNFNSGGKALDYNVGTNPMAWGIGHTLRIGDGVSTQPSSNTNGFILEQYTSTGKLLLGNLVISGGSTTNRHTSLGAWSTFTSGNLTVEAGSEFRINSSSTNAVFGGNIINNGTITATVGMTMGGTTGNSTVAATNPQSIGGTGVFRNLTATPTANLTTLVINNSSSGGVTLAVPLTIGSTLSLTAGSLNTTATNLVTVGISGTNTGTISRTSGMVNGPVRKWVGTTATSYTIPVGDGTNYKPTVINFTAAPTAAGTLTTQWFPAQASNNGLPLNEPAVTPSSIEIVAPGYWGVEAGNGLAGGTYTGTFTSNNVTGVLAFAQTTLLKRANNSSPWTLEGTHVATTGSNTAPMASRSGLSGFSEFAIGGGVGTIPVVVEYFRGAKQGNDHRFEWKVSCTNTPSATLTLERSSDGRNFSSVYTITATALRCLQPFDYTDNKPLPGINYYRLKMADADGKVTYSTIVALLNARSGFELVNIAPNPVPNDRFKLNITSVEQVQMEVVIADMQGKVVSRRNIQLMAGFNAVDMNVGQLAGGTYQLFGVTAAGRTKVLSFVKE
jgi:hypothetical protein